MKEKPFNNKSLSDESYKLIDKEISKYPPAQKKSAVIAALAIAQREHGFVNEELEREIASYLEMEAISVHEILTFYNMFNREGTGKYKISVCTNLPCALRNSRYTVDFLKSFWVLKLEKQLRMAYSPFWRENALEPVLMLQYCY